MDFKKLRKEDDAYYWSSERNFNAVASLSREDVTECFEFAYDMAFGEGHHRSYRSGGQANRKPGEIFINTFQGKIAEFAIYRLFQTKGLEISAPDMSREGVGIWDSVDFVYKNSHIAIKSTSHIGNLLLLETKDWNADGEYIPNIDRSESKYDYFVLIRIKPDGKKIMTSKRWFYSTQIEKQELKQVIVESQNWEYDIAGYITNEELKWIINNEYILPQNAYLQGSTPMDARNYYVQSGDMHRIEDLIDELKNK